jgi:hypothetical protein
MTILIPWKPVVLIWLLLSAMVLAGYLGSYFIEGKNPFVPYHPLIDGSRTPQSTSKGTTQSLALSGRGVAGRERPR